ncbi:MAG: carbohydrate kinase [Pseudolysinimonas sp.]
MLEPVVLTSNRPAPRFYRGGRRITDFRGDAPAGEFEPEDWVGSTTTVAGHEALGLTVLPDGRTLADAVATDPEGWLGAAHVARYGADTRLLVKLLDPGQRLPVHAHPSAAWATEHVARAHGKVEAWFILSPGDVHLGLRADVSDADLHTLVSAQDTAGLLALLNTVPVVAGDVVFVPAGVLHAIGEAVLLVELQEPEDLSILLEWRGFELDGERDGHLGVGFDLALTAVDHHALTPARLAELVRPAGYGSVFPTEADEFFRLERVAVDGTATLDAGFTILVVTEGEVRMGDLTLPRGRTVVVPDAAGAIVLSGRGEVLACRPPAS